MVTGRTCVQYLKSTIVPASGTVVPAYNSGCITQLVQIENTAHGQVRGFFPSM
jgi:hypothetical protein